MVDPAADSVSERELERDAERFAGAIYGTIVTAGVLIASVGAGEADAVDAWRAAGLALATVVVFWLAHGWSRAIARRVTGLRRAGVWETLRRDWPMLASALPPLVVMGVAALLGADDEGAIAAAVWSTIAILAGTGGFVARREGASMTQAVIAALGSAALGGLLVLLKVLVQH